MFCFDYIFKYSNIHVFFYKQPVYKKTFLVLMFWIIVKFSIPIRSKFYPLSKTPRAYFIILHVGACKPALLGLSNFAGKIVADF